MTQFQKNYKRFRNALNIFNLHSCLGGTATHCLVFTKLQKNSRVAGQTDRPHAVIDFLRGSTPVGKPGGHSAALHLKLRSSDSGRSWRGTSKLNYDLTETPGRSYLNNSDQGSLERSDETNNIVMTWHSVILLYVRIIFYNYFYLPCDLIL